MVDSEKRDELHTGGKYLYLYNFGDSQTESEGERRR